MNKLIHAEIYRNYAITIYQSADDRYGYHAVDAYLSGSLRPVGEFYPTQGEAIAAAHDRVDRDCNYQAGFDSFDRGEPLPAGANPDFSRGWMACQHSYGAAA